MIDTKELRRLVQSVQAPAHNINERANAIHNLHDALPSGVVLELLDRLEAAESDALEQARLNGMGASREAALMVKLEAAEKEVAHIKEVEFPRKARAVAVGWETKCARLEQERDALRAKIEATERQEPVAWMLNCQTLGGDTGWMLSWTQSGAGMCNRLSGEENERKLYTIPGAQPAPSIRPAALSPVINWLRNGCDPMEAADELEILASLRESR